MILKKSMSEIEETNLRYRNQQQSASIIFILDNIRSMHNVGSAFRTADIFQAESVFLAGYTPCPPHRDIHKTALGATETVAWKHFPGTEDAINAARSEGYKIYAAEQAQGSIMLHQWQPDTDKVAIIFGNEVEGVPDHILGLCDGAIEIPQSGTKHSLNVSVSIGIIAWEIRRNC